MSLIRESLNGIGRVIEYGLTHKNQILDFALQADNSHQLKLYSVIEGEIKMGHFDGFARSVDSEGNCQAGFFSTKMSSLENDKGSKLISRPYGKWASYTYQGEPIYKPGIYRGDQKDQTRCLEVAQIKDFYENVEPKQSFGAAIGEYFANCCCEDKDNME